MEVMSTSASICRVIGGFLSSNIRIMSSPLSGVPNSITARCSAGQPQLRIRSRTMSLVKIGVTIIISPSSFNRS